MNEILLEYTDRPLNKNLCNSCESSKQNQFRSNSQNGGNSARRQSMKDIHHNKYIFGQEDDKEF